MSFQGYPGSGINLQLAFVSNAWSEAEEDRIATQEFVDFQRERGKVGVSSHHFGLSLFSGIDECSNVIVVIFGSTVEDECSVL